MSDNSIEMPASSEKPVKRRIVKPEEYTNICDFVNQYRGLAIDCEIDLLREFPQFEKQTIKSVLVTILTNRMRAQCWRYTSNAKKYMQMYEDRCKQTNPQNRTILLDIARSEGIGPVMMCRSLLKLKYKLSDKQQLSDMIRTPHIIPDPQLSANVSLCVTSDSQDGPLIDLMRRAMGEEYEFKLKQLADKAGMHYYDENDLRRMGYDKTPDIKMVLPFLYKGSVINWIESKANFGDIKTHKSYINTQLQSYCNRFGSGIVIYWFGYQVETATLVDNGIGIIVLDEFPPISDIHLIDLTDAGDTYDSNPNEIVSQENNT